MSLTLRDLSLGPWARDILTNPYIVAPLAFGGSLWGMNKLFGSESPGMNVLGASIPAFASGYLSYLAKQDVEGAKYMGLDQKQKDTYSGLKTKVDDLYYGRIPTDNPYELKTFNPKKVFTPQGYGQLGKYKAHVDKVNKYMKYK